MSDRNASDRRDAPVAVGAGPGRRSVARLRVLLLAYACSPSRGSEPGIGWHRAVECARHADTWVLCKAQRNEEAIGRHFRNAPRPPGLAFHFLPNTPLERALKRLPGLWYLAYHLWHRRAFRAARRLHRRYAFDLAHQVTLTTYREPAPLWRLGIPFIWGPVGGTENYPLRFLPAAGLRGALTEGARAALNRLQLRLDPRVRTALRRAAAVLVANETARRDLASVAPRDYILMPNIGADEAAVRPVDAGTGEGLEEDHVPSCRTAPASPSRPLRLVWSGVMEHRKALHLLLEALRDLPAEVSVELTLLGDGPAASRWRRLARRYGIAERCRWLGWLPRAESLQYVAGADVLVFTSLRDSGGMVLLEAMAHGVPAICLAHQAADLLISEDCGVRIPVTTHSDVVGGLRDAIAALARDAGRLVEMGRWARERAAQFAWSRQGERIAEIYRRVLAAGAGAPKGEAG